MWRAGVVVLALLLPAGLAARGEEPPTADQPAARLAAGIQQLRHAHGRWAATTELLTPDGSVARAVEGTYTFRWVIEDRVLAGESEIPELGQRSALLFYVVPGRGEIEMVSVSADGDLWVMSGPIDGNVRSTGDKSAADGGTIRLRFSTHEVKPDSFVSRMELSTDGGESWRPGNRQRFRRLDGGVDGD